MGLLAREKGKVKREERSPQAALFPRTEGRYPALKQRGILGGFPSLREEFPKEEGAEE